MAEGDRLILATDRCSTCSGAGWTWWSVQPDAHARGKWVVCRSCLGTGRNDQIGAKREMPSHVPPEPSLEPRAERAGADGGAADTADEGGPGPGAASDTAD